MTKRGRPAGSKNKKQAPKINWEVMARELQKALRDEIQEGFGKVDVIESLEFEVRNLKHQIVGYQAVISYLENKLGHHSV